MRLTAILMTLLLVVAACADTTDDDVDDVAAPDPTPTEEIAEDPTPDPTPEPTATPLPDEDADDDATADDAVAGDDGEATAEPDSDDPADLSEQIDQITENVIELRGLELLEELDVRFMDRDELQEYIESNIEVEQHDIDREWLLRLIPDRDADIAQKLIDVQVADVGGFYDHETGETVVISDEESLSPAEETFLAHEIVHALQDQHFDLSRLDDLMTDGDAALAFRSVVEGDAVLSQNQYAETYFDQEQQMEFQQDMMAAQQDEATMAAVEELPSYYLETFVFPYTAGPEFMSQVIGDDLNNMDEYIENPPTSTYQVINAQAYINGEIDDPVEVESTGIGDRLEGDWELVSEGTFGAFNLFMILYENDASDPVVPFDGWAGDRFDTYVSENDHVLVSVSTVWQNAEQAEAYEEQLVETMADYDEEDGVYIGDGRYHVVVQDGDTLDLISSTDPDALLDAAEMN
jgi:hypothetical protein